MLFIDYVNVLFSSNSQHSIYCGALTYVVYRLCQCSLFKQFTTNIDNTVAKRKLFIDYVNVLFSSNSQLLLGTRLFQQCCLSIMSMFSFQAIHNRRERRRRAADVVYRLCQCSLFKQFTTWLMISCNSLLLFIDYVNVLFSSNSQRNSRLIG